MGYAAMLLFYALETRVALLACMGEGGNVAVVNGLSGGCGEWFTFTVHSLLLHCQPLPNWGPREKAPAHGTEGCCYNEGGGPTQRSPTPCLTCLGFRAPGCVLQL